MSVYPTFIQNLSFSVSPESVSSAKELYHRLRSTSDSGWEHLIDGISICRKDNKWYTAFGSVVLHVPHPAFVVEHKDALFAKATPKVAVQWEEIAGLKGYAWMVNHGGSWWYCIKGEKPQKAPTKNWIMANIVAMVSEHFADLANEEEPEEEYPWSSVDGIGKKLERVIEDLIMRKGGTQEEFVQQGQMWFDSKIGPNQKAQITKALIEAGIW